MCVYIYVLVLFFFFFLKIGSLAGSAPPYFVSIPLLKRAVYHMVQCPFYERGVMSY